VIGGRKKRGVDLENGTREENVLNSSYQTEIAFFFSFFS
jgi:hypothetical protein